MVKELLRAAGIPGKPSRYADPPASTYAVYFEGGEMDGPDIPDAGCPILYTGDVTVELYELEQDDAKEAAFEAELNARGIYWTKQDRYWLQNVKRYQTIYEFTYHEKRRI